MPFCCCQLTHQHVDWRCCLTFPRVTHDEMHQMTCRHAWEITCYHIGLSSYSLVHTYTLVFRPTKHSFCCCFFPFPGLCANLNTVRSAPRQPKTRTTSSRQSAEERLDRGGCSGKLFFIKMTSSFFRSIFPSRVPQTHAPDLRGAGQNDRHRNSRSSEARSPLYATTFLFFPGLFDQFYKLQAISPTNIFGIVARSTNTAVKMKRASDVKAACDIVADKAKANAARARAYAAGALPFGVGFLV